MPRQARTTSATSVYHAILRGVNKQQVPPRCHVYAYCLMGNHVHILVKDGSEIIGEIMKPIFHRPKGYERLITLQRSGVRASP